MLGNGGTSDIGDESGEMESIDAINLGTGRTATQISAGYQHTCAVLDNGEVKCWGKNNRGQLGQEHDDNIGDSSGEMASLSAVFLGSGRTAAQVETGNFHTCALLDNGSVKCWGHNDKGQLGMDNTDRIGEGSGDMTSLGVVNLGSGRTATQISLGKKHSCAILDNGSAKCWGENANGLLGHDNNSTSLGAIGDAPSEMALLKGINLGTGRTAIQIDAGQAQNCALIDNGQVKCWGGNDQGGLGIGGTGPIGTTPEANHMSILNGINFGSTSSVLGISTGLKHACAVFDNSSVKCWGANGYGQLGQGHDDDIGDSSGEMSTLPDIDL